MTASLPGATLQSQPHDDPMADPRPTPPDPSPPGHAPAARPSAWAKLAENPLPSVLSAVIVVLLGFSLTVTNVRISDANDRITRLEARMDDRFAVQDDKIDKLDNKIDEINLKLTALIVALEASGTIDGVVENQIAATAPAGYGPSAQHSATGSADDSHPPRPKAGCGPSAQHSATVAVNGCNTADQQSAVIRNRSAPATSPGRRAGI